MNFLLLSFNPTPTPGNFQTGGDLSSGYEPAGAIQTEVSGDLIGENGAILGEG